MKTKLLLIGAGGHCKVILDLLFGSEKYDVSGIIDLKERVSGNIFGVPVIGTDSDLPKFFKKGIKHCFISVGSVGDSDLRAKLYGLAREAEFIFPNLIHPSALVSSKSMMGHGNYVAPGAILNAGARIGNNCIINTGVIVEHDCKVGDFVHLSPGSILSGNVIVGDRSHLGAGSVVIQGLEIGANVIIGAGSVVAKNIQKNTIAYGNPCKERKKNA